MSLSPPLYSAIVFPLRRRWPADLSAALSILAAIAFGTGVTDADIRHELAGLVWGSLAAAAVFGALWWQLRARLKHRMKVYEGRVSLQHRGGVTEVHRPFQLERGWFTEWVLVGRAHRQVPVYWVRVAGGHETLIFRRGMGAFDKRPTGAWPVAPLPAGPTFSGLALDLEQLWAALEAPTPE